MSIYAYIGCAALLVVLAVAIEWFVVWLLTPGNEMEGY